MVYLQYFWFGNHQMRGAFCVHMRIWPTLPLTLSFLPLPRAHCSPRLPTNNPRPPPKSTLSHVWVDSLGPARTSSPRPPLPPTFPTTLPNQPDWRCTDACPEAACLWIHPVLHRPTHGACTLQAGGGTARRCVECGQ